MPPGRYSTAMPQFGWLKDADAAALFTYLRSSFGNHAAPVDAATVASALEGMAP
jgi:mono/diheme cytochrome c family protein